MSKKKIVIPEELRQAALSRWYNTKDHETILELTGNNKTHESCKYEQECLDKVPHEALSNELRKLGMSVEGSESL